MIYGNSHLRSGRDCSRHAAVISPLSHNPVTRSDTTATPSQWEGTNQLRVPGTIDFLGHQVCLELILKYVLILGLTRKFTGRLRVIIPDDTNKFHVFRMDTSQLNLVGMLQTPRNIHSLHFQAIHVYTDLNTGQTNRDFFLK